MTIDDNLDDMDRILEKHCQNVHRKELGNISTIVIINP